MQSYGQKDPVEDVPLGFDFAPLLSSGEVISGVQWAVLDPEDGTDVSNSMLSGPTIVTGSIVKQFIQGGISGLAYQHRITIHTNLNSVYVEKPTQFVTAESV